MKVSPETMERINQDFIEDQEVFTDRQPFLENLHRGRSKPPGIWGKRSYAPPGLREAFMLILSMGFNPEGAGDTKAVIQFNFSGEAEGACYFRIENGRIEPQMG